MPAKPPTPLPLLDNPTAPDLFADEAVGFIITNDTLRITFSTARIDHTTEARSKSRAVVGRLIMPLSSIEGFQKLLAAAVEMKTRSQGPDIGTHTLQ